jgi:amino-acid N-acetyltransferase
VKPAAGEALVTRKAVAADAWEIAELVNGYAAEEVMLPRAPEDVLLVLDDYVVATDAHGRLLACAALKEYSPSLAEVVSVAVAREAHGRGLGRVMVAAAERLAARRGYGSVFAHTLSPCFFEAVGYAVVDRGRYPEKHGRPHTACVERALSEERRPRLRIAA